MAVVATYQLTHPITYTVNGAGGERTETISEVEIHEPTAKHMLVFDDLGNKPIALQFAMLEKLTALPRRHIELLHPADFVPLGELVGSLFERGPTTGESA